MSQYNTLGNSLKVGLLNFSEKITKNFGRIARKFISNMLFGIISSNSCKLTDIGRAQKEKIELKKTVERLGRNLSDFTESEKLMQNYISAVKSFIGPDTNILLDGGDVTKPCSPKMESIGTVHDGSTGKFAPGYWTMGAVALSSEFKQPIPVYEKLYPCKKQGGSGAKAETLECLKSLRENFDGSIPRVGDRGFDSGEIILDLYDHKENFIIRVNQNRVAVHKGQQTYIDDIVRGMVCEYEIELKDKDGKAKKCRIGMTQIILPRMKNIKLNLVVCKDFGKDPLVLYTNLSESLENIAVRVVKIYLMRWRIDEHYAFKKQGFHYEDFRVRSLNSIKTLDLLLTIAIGYIAILSEGADSGTVYTLIGISKRITKTARFIAKTKFLAFAILDGISFVFAALQCGISHFFSPSPPNPQLSFLSFDFLG